MAMELARLIPLPSCMRTARNRCGAALRSILMPRSLNLERHCSRATRGARYLGLRGAWRAHCTESARGGKAVEREILVQHLLVKEDQLQTLNDLEKRLAVEDIDLGALVSEHSICPSKRDKGMLGWVSKGKMVPEFEEAAFGAPLNKVVRVKTQFGWHLLQVLSEREAGFLVEIQPEELSRRMEDPEFEGKSQLVDVREPNEIEVASIEGFKPFPLSKFGEWSRNISETLDVSKDTYVLCHHGVRSLQASNWLKSQGFKRVHNVSGGIHAYSTRVDDSIPVY